MDEVEEQIVGQCPHCAAEVAYESWMAIDGEDDIMGCPECKSATPVESVFPLVATAQYPVASQAAA